jgi:glutamate-1-semialdehyde 2,1-aminomutase
VKEMIGYYILAGGATLYTLGKLKQRLELSFAKNPSLAGHPRMARRFAALIPYYSYNEQNAFSLDGAPETVVLMRKAALAALTENYHTRYTKSLQLSTEVEKNISDMQFINAYRVPFQFRELISTSFKPASFVESTSGVTVKDLDGNVFYDLAGSYGVNVFGYDYYKDSIIRGSALVANLGPLLGSYHPVVAENVSMLKQVSSLDEVSFHMSGTEAVMQAVRLARYNSKRKYLVRFCGAYHGWWGDVQPGIGNPARARDTLTLKEMGEQTLQVLRKRKDIACILVNPLQAMHLNSNASGDSSLLDSSRTASYSREAYKAWLQNLRKICDEKNIALIFDEVFLGFRLAAGGAQEYFDVRADMVTYGKTLGGGLPVGVLCGKHAWMKRFREESPADICFARGTFNAHPYVMGTMNIFLKSLEEPSIKKLYENLDEVWNNRANTLNQRLLEAKLPVQVVNMSTVWTVLYTQPSCYNWLFQYYLRLEGLALSWVGTGRFIFSLNYTDKDFEAVMQRFEHAANLMQTDGWWHPSAELTNKSIKRRILHEMLMQKLS